MALAGRRRCSLNSRNARVVFDYFTGYKLGLTATTREYLRRFDSAQPGTRDPRNVYKCERLLLRDTYVSLNQFAP